MPPSSPSSSPPSPAPASPPLFVLYGSATGNAEHIAKDLADKIRSSNHNNPPSSSFPTSVVCCELDQFKKQKCLESWSTPPPPPPTAAAAVPSQRKHGVIVVTSTTGNADPPENASRFVRYIKRKTTEPTQPFKHCAYAVLGLGDTNYDQFCAMGKLVDRKLSDLGGTRAKPLGMADEATGLEDTVEPWVATVLGDLSKACCSEGEGGEGSSPEAAMDGGMTAQPKEESGSTGEATSSAAAAATAAEPPKAQTLPQAPTSNDGGTTTTAVADGSAVATAAAARSGKSAAPANGGDKDVTSPDNKVSGVDDDAAAAAAAATATTAEPVAAAATKSTKGTSPLFVLYGSATGNAEHIAKDLAETYDKRLAEAPESCYFPSVVCCELDRYKRQCSATWDSEPMPPGTKHGVVVVTSTTGNADAPENASRFVRYIKRKTTAPARPFKHCAYAVLGLGDTNYDQFCAMGKLVDRKLSELGGWRAKPLGMADEATGLEDTVEPWVSSVLQDLTNACNGSGAADGAGGSIEDGAAVADPSGARKGLTSSASENVAEERLAAAKTAVDTVADEEKKTEGDVGDGTFASGDNGVQEKLPSSPDITVEISGQGICSQGVATVRNLLSLQDDASIPSVDHSSLPPLGPSLSSCELIHHTEDERRSRGMSLSEMADNMTISTASSSGIHYTIAHPYESTVLGARYLTQTDVCGAKKACEAMMSDELDSGEKLIRARSCFEQQFPLSPRDESDGKKEDALQYERNGKRVIEMTLSLPDDFTLEYQPGDSIGLLVPNSPQSTKFILSVLRDNHGIIPTQKVSLDEKHPITVADAVRHHIDLCSPIKNKRILLSLSQFASDPEEERALRLLSCKTSKGEDLFSQYVDAQRRSVVDVMKDFPSCQSITLEGLLGFLPGIPPRYYSVSSSPLAKEGKEGGNHLTVAFSVVDYVTPILPGDGGSGRRVGGLATCYLEAICSPFLCESVSTMSDLATVKVFPKPSGEFRLPSTVSTPLILIGPGTGIAPFMGFLSHRQAQIEASESTQAAKAASEGTWRGGFELEEDDLPITKRDASGLVLGADYRNRQIVGSVDLFFGCRHKNHDWLYHDEMKAFEQIHVISKLHTAFSRDSAAEKVYVQDKMKSDAKRLVQLIMDESAAVYVCGDGNAMGKDVQQRIVDIIAAERYGGTGDNSQPEAQMKAKAYLEGMKARKKFLMDIWS